MKKYVSAIALAMLSVAPRNPIMGSGVWAVQSGAETVVRPSGCFGV